MFFHNFLFSVFVTAQQGHLRQAMRNLHSRFCAYDAPVLSENGILILHIFTHVHRGFKIRKSCSTAVVVYVLETI